VDPGNSVDVHDKITRELVTQIMGGSGAEWDEKAKQQALTLLASPSQRSHDKLLYVGNIVFRYRLLDVFARVLESPEKGRHSIVSRSPRPVSTTRKLDQVSTCVSSAYVSMPNLPQVYESLQNWPNIVTEFYKLHQANVSNKSKSAFIAEGFAPVPGSLEGNQKQFLAGIHCLAAACQQRENAKYHKILANIMVLASCLWWIGMVSDLNAYIYSLYRAITRVSKIYHLIRML